MQRVIESPVFKELIHEVDAIQSTEDIWKTFGSLQRKGIRQPLHLNKLFNGKYQLDQPRVFSVDQTQIQALLRKMSRTTDVEQDYLELHRATFYAEPSMRKWKIADIRGHLQFQIQYYVEHLDHLTEIQVDDHMLLDLATSVHTQSIQKWKNYLISAVIRSVLHHLRMLVPTNSEICISQLAEYFPLHICRRFKGN